MAGGAFLATAEPAAAFPTNCSTWTEYFPAGYWWAEAYCDKGTGQFRAVATCVKNGVSGTVQGNWRKVGTISSVAYCSGTLTANWMEAKN